MSKMFKIALITLKGIVMIFRSTLCFIAVVVLFIACQQSSAPQPVTPANPIIPKPEDIPDALTKIYTDSGLQGSLTQQNTTNLLQNGDFESLEGWTACNGATNALVLSDDAHSGSKAGFLQQAGSCFYQSASASSGQVISLSCYANLLENTAWTGLGVAFSDDTWQAVGSAPTKEVRGNIYRQYVTSGTAPANTTYATMWVYTDDKVLVDTCEMFVGDPPVPTGNLLLNADFSAGLDYWSVCGDHANVTASAGTITTSNGACVYQTANVLPNLNYTLSCNGKYDGQGDQNWNTMILSFLDQNWNSVEQTFVRSIPHFYLEQTFGDFVVSLKSPANSYHAAVAFYTEGEVIYDYCSLIAGESADNLTGTFLSNGGFEQNLDNWVNCGSAGSIEIVSNQVYEGVQALALLDGCISQTLVLEPKQYHLTCRISHLTGPVGIINAQIGGVSDGNHTLHGGYSRLVNVISNVSGGNYEIKISGRGLVDACALY